MSTQYDKIIQVLEGRKKVLEKALEEIKKKMVRPEVVPYHGLYEEQYLYYNRHEAALQEIESILSTTHWIRNAHVKPVKVKEVQ